MIEELIRRDLATIRFDILKAARVDGGVLITHLMYRVNTNHTVLTKMVSEMISKGLIAERSEPTKKGNKKYVYTTEKGLSALEHYDIACESLQSEDSQLQPRYD